MLRSTKGLSAMMIPRGINPLHGLPTEVGSHQLKDLDRVLSDASVPHHVKRSRVLCEDFIDFRCFPRRQSGVPVILFASEEMGKAMMWLNAEMSYLLPSDPVLGRGKIGLRLARYLLLTSPPMPIVVWICEVKSTGSLDNIIDQTTDIIESFSSMVGKLVIVTAASVSASGALDYGRQTHVATQLHNFVKTRLYHQVQILTTDFAFDAAGMSYSARSTAYEQSTVARRALGRSWPDVVISRWQGRIPDTLQGQTQFPTSIFEFLDTGTTPFAGRRDDNSPSVYGKTVGRAEVTREQVEALKGRAALSFGRLKASSASTKRQVKKRTAAVLGAARAERTREEVPQLSIPDETPSSSPILVIDEDAPLDLATSQRSLPITLEVTTTSIAVQSVRRLGGNDDLRGEPSKNASGTSILLHKPLPILPRATMGETTTTWSLTRPPTTWAGLQQPPPQSAPATPLTQLASLAMAVTGSPAIQLVDRMEAEGSLHTPVIPTPLIPTPASAAVATPPLEIDEVPSTPQD